LDLARAQNDELSQHFEGIWKEINVSAARSEEGNEWTDATDESLAAQETQMSTLIDALPKSAVFLFAFVPVAVLNW
jgi:hypothetical protein